MAYISNVLNEKQFLCCLLEKPELIEKVEKNHFVTPEAGVLFEVFQVLRAESVTPTVEHLINEGNKRNPLITEENLGPIFKTEHDVASFDYYHRRLRSDKARWTIEHEVMQNIFIHVAKKGELNVPLLEQFIEQIQENIDLVNGDKTRLISPSEFMNKYMNQVDKRNHGMDLWPTGDSQLDKMLIMGFSPGDQTGLFGDTGMGKSMVGLNWTNKIINKRIPCASFGLEMPLMSTGDRLIALRNHLMLRQLLPRVSGESLEEFVMELLEKERQRFEKMNSFFFIDETNMYIRDVENLIKEAKKKMKVDYLVAFIDLWSMLKDVSGRDPGDYEEGMNKSLEVAKRQHVHLINIIQMKRPDSGFRPTTLESLQRLRPTRNSIKNSSAIAERCRNIFGVFREKYYADEYFHDDPEVQSLDDIVEIQNLKQSQGDIGGMIRYYHHPGQFRLSRIEESDLRDMQAHRQQIIENSRVRTPAPTTPAS